MVLAGAVASLLAATPAPRTPLPPSAPPAPAAPPRALPEGAVTPRPEGPDWVDLIDADHASNWQPNIAGAGAFEIQDSALHIFGGQQTAYVGFMAERLRDFSLHIEFKLGKTTNSGVILRGETDNPPYSGMEIQILDDRGRPATISGCGALYDVACPMFNMSMPAGEWNSYDITCKGRSLIVYMNGWKILDIDCSKMTMPVGKFATPFAQLATDGYLFLEDRGGEVWFRNIMLKKL